MSALVVTPALVRRLLGLVAALTSAVEHHRCPACRTTYLDPDMLAAIRRVADFGVELADAPTAPEVAP